MASEWRATVPRDIWDLYEKAGFGETAGLGTRPAVLVIDVQYRTVGDTPLPIEESIERYYSTSCGEIGWRAVEEIQKLLVLAREQGVPVIYPHVAPKRSVDAGRTGDKIPTLVNLPERSYAFVEEVKPRPDELTVPKRYASAFFGTPLASFLIDAGVDTVLLTGCTTSGCVRATATDACAYNFRCGVVEECVFDRSQLSHDVNLFDMDSKSADVMTLADTMRFLQSVDDSAPAMAT